MKNNRLNKLNRQIVLVTAGSRGIGKEIVKIGLYDAKINLHAEVQATIHIEVVKEEEEK